MFFLFLLCFDFFLVAQDGASFQQSLEDKVQTYYNELAELYRRKHVRVPRSDLEAMKRFLHCQIHDDLSEAVFHVILIWLAPGAMYGRTSHMFELIGMCFEELAGLEIKIAHGAEWISVPDYFSSKFQKLLETISLIRMDDGLQFPKREFNYPLKISRDLFTLPRDCQKRRKEGCALTLSSWNKFFEIYGVFIPNRFEPFKPFSSDHKESA